MTFVNTKPRRQNSHRADEWKRCPPFLQWLRGRSCIAYGDCLCGGRMEAAHVDYAGDKGMGTKVSDRFAVALCSDHHAHQHSIGWPEFERKCLRGEGSALKAAEAFWKAWPGRLAWERAHPIVAPDRGVP